MGVETTHLKGLFCLQRGSGALVGGHRAESWRRGLGIGEQGSREAPVQGGESGSEAGRGSWGSWSLLLCGRGPKGLSPEGSRPCCWGGVHKGGSSGGRTRRGQWWSEVHQAEG